MERWKAVKPKLVNIEVFLSLYITLLWLKTIDNYKIAMDNVRD